MMSIVTMIILGLSIILSFAALVWSAMASSDAGKLDMEKSKKYSAISAVLSGLVVAMLFVELGLHFYYSGGSESMMY